MKYAISITETLNRVVIVNAPDEGIAINNVRLEYNGGNIVLDADDFQDSSIQYEPMYIIDNNDKVINE